jgi:hypothetical protein
MDPRKNPSDGTQEQTFESRGRSWTERTAGTPSDTRKRLMYRDMGQGEIDVENGNVREDQDDGEISFEEPLPNSGPLERPLGPDLDARERLDVGDNEEEAERGRQARLAEEAEADAERTRKAEEAARKLAEEAERERQARVAAGAEAKVADEEKRKGSLKPKVTWDEHIQERIFYDEPEGTEHPISETGRLKSPADVEGRRPQSIVDMDPRKKPSDGTQEQTFESRGRGWTERTAGTPLDTRERFMYRDMGRGEIDVENGNVREDQDDGEISFEEPLPNSGPLERPLGPDLDARERPDVGDNEERGGNDDVHDDETRSDDGGFSIEALLRRLRETGANIGEGKILREYVRRAHERGITRGAVINGWDQPSDIRRTKRRAVGSDHVATGPGYDRGALLSTGDDMISAAEDYIRNQEGHVFVFGSEGALDALRPNPGVIVVPSSGRQLPPWVWMHGNLLFIGKTQISNAVRQRLESVTGQQYPKVSVLVSREEERSLTPDESVDLHKLIAGAGRRGIMCAESICDGIPI